MSNKQNSKGLIGVQNSEVSHSDIQAYKQEQKILKQYKHRVECPYCRAAYRVIEQDQGTELLTYIVEHECPECQGHIEDKNKYGTYMVVNNIASLKLPL